MTDFFLLHLLAAVAGATFGLMVVWVAVSRRRWLLRFALIAAAIGCLIPVPAFDLAVAAVSQAFVVAGSLSVIRRFTTMREPASESHANANGWLRFSLTS